MHRCADVVELGVTCRASAVQRLREVSESGRKAGMVFALGLERMIARVFGEGSLSDGEHEVMAEISDGVVIIVLITTTSTTTGFLLHHCTGWKHVHPEENQRKQLLQIRRQRHWHRHVAVVLLQQLQVLFVLFSFVPSRIFRIILFWKCSFVQHFTAHHNL